MGVSADAPAREAGSSRLSIVLAAAMFVLVVDTSLMNVSIASVVKDLDTTVSSVQSAIALEALVSAAFILISNERRRSGSHRPSWPPSCTVRAGWRCHSAGRLHDGDLQSVAS
jgi:hypothetical protein